MVVSDSKNHSPGIANEGPFLMMNPFSSRCCQHNHSAGWVYYLENTWMATADNGLAAQLYSAGEVSAKVGSGTEVKITENTFYPFNDRVNFTIHAARTVAFPLYLRVPAWCRDASVTVNGKPVPVKAKADGYIVLSNKWKNGDRIALHLPMNITLKEWDQNKNSVSVNYGPLTFSLKIAENYVKEDSRKSTEGDSGWQQSADPAKWPAYNIYAASAWNYGLLVDKKHPERSFSVIKRLWPKDNNPFTNTNAPIELTASGKLIPGWTTDATGLCGVLPQSPVKSDAKVSSLTLVPMGGARLRISAFPVME
jgi:hypothetical protein